MAYKLTPSALHVFDDCPKCFWLEHNKGIKRPRGIFPSLPNGIDKALKEYFDTLAAEGSVPPEFDDLGVEIFDEPILDTWRTNWEGIKHTDEEGNILKGAVDAILKKDNKLIVLDYKTRGYPIKANTHEFYIDQLAIYTYLLRKNGHETEDYAFLLFYYPDKVKPGQIDFHTQLVKVPIEEGRVETVWKEALSVLKGKIPPSDEDCEYCRYRSATIEKSLKDF